MTNVQDDSTATSNPVKSVNQDTSIIVTIKDDAKESPIKSPLKRESDEPDEFAYLNITSGHSKIFQPAKMNGSQKWCYHFFEKPSSISAKIFNVISYVFIVYSTVEVVVETLPEFAANDGSSTFPGLQGIFAMEILLFLWWSIELLGRFYASTNKILFTLDPLTWIDVFAILPFFFIVTKSNDTTQNISRVFRLIRILKAIKLAQYSVGLQLMTRSLRRSLDAIWMLFLFLILSMLVTSSAMFWAERGTWDPAYRYWVRADGSRSPYNSVPEGFYWSITTLATVGYGDVVPVTGIGKLIAALTMLLSIMTIALPTSIIGSNFMAEWQIYQRALLQKKMDKYRHESDTDLSEKKKIVPDTQLVQEQNTIMLQLLGEIQDKICDVNPPQYYQKFKDYQAKNDRLKLKILDLEKDLSTWKSKCQAYKRKYEELNSLKSQNVTSDLKKNLLLSQNTSHEPNSPTTSKKGLFGTKSVPSETPENIIKSSKNFLNMAKMVISTKKADKQTDKPVDIPGVVQEDKVSNASKDDLHTETKVGGSMRVPSAGSSNSVNNQTLSRRRSFSVFQDMILKAEDSSDKKQ